MQNHCKPPQPHLHLQYCIPMTFMVNAQKGKAIKVDAANLLIIDAQWVMNH